MPTTPLSKLMSVEDVAEVTGMSPGGIRSWRHRGIGPRSFKVGSRVVFDPADVQAWLEEQRAATSRGGTSATDHPAA